MAAVDADAIREETRRRFQGSIDAIEATYADLSRQEAVAGQDRVGQTRAVNARSGLIGSDFGAASAEKTTQYNKQQQQSIANERDAKIASVMANIEDRASRAISEERAMASEQYTRDWNAYQAEQASARADFDALAKAGFNLDTMDPNTKASLFSQAGYDDPAMAELVYNAQKPKPQQVDWKMEKLEGGKLLFYGVDPTTGEIKQQMLNYDLPPDYQFTIAPDGTPLIFNKNTGEAQIAGSQGQFAKPEQSDILYDPDSNTYSVTPQEAVKLNKEVANTDTFKSIVKAQDALRYITEFENAFNSSGKGINVFGNKAGEVGAKYNTAVLNLKEFFNLGALTGPDVDAIKALLPDPTSVKTHLKGGGPAVTAGIENIKKLIRDTLEERYQGLSTQFQDYNAGQITNLQEATRIYEQVTGNKIDDEVERARQELGEPTDPKAVGGKTPYLKTLGAVTGPNGSPVWRYGLDVDVKKGQPVKSPVSGTVIATKTGYNGGFGNQVKIKTDDGRELWLSHFDAVNVKQGQQVKAGQVIALGGNSGKVIPVGGGDGSHVDITMPKPGGGYYSAPEVQKYLSNNSYDAFRTTTSKAP